MNSVIAWTRRNPTRVVAAIGVLVGALAFVGVPNEIVGTLSVVWGILTGTAVYGAVTPNDTVRAAVTQAATAAAGGTAYRIDAPTAGVADHITAKATDLAHNVAHEVTGDVLRDVGINPRKAS